MTAKADSGLGNFACSKEHGQGKIGGRKVISDVSRPESFFESLSVSHTRRLQRRKPLFFSHLR